MNAKGFVHKYGDNVDTDVIIPARYLNIADKKELATHCMEDIDKHILECPEASEKIQSGDEVAIDFDTGLITNLTKGETYQANPFPAFIKEIIQAGGLMADIKKRQEA